MLTPGTGIGELTDTAVARAAEGFLRSRRSSDPPFFLNVGLLQPHDCCYWVFEHPDDTIRTRIGALPEDLPPLPPNHAAVPSPEPKALTNRRGGRSPCANWSERQWRWYLWNYHRMVEMADADLGRVLDALEETGLIENTVIVWSADHGDGLGRHGLTSKMFLYDEAARVPLVVVGPGRAGGGRRDRTHLVSGLDIAPTLCDFAGIEPPPKARGLSLRPLVEGRSPQTWRECLFAEAEGTGRMVRTPEYKLITYRGDPAEQLFDMRADPGETMNLAGDAARADVVRDLRRRLDEWERTLEIRTVEPRSERPARRARA